MPTINDKEAGNLDDDPDALSRIPTGWLSILILFGAMLLVSALIYGIVHRRRDRLLDSVRRDDPEAAGSAFGAALDGHARAMFEAISPVTKFKQLKADNGSKAAPSPPDQRGSSVVCVICLETFKEKSMVRRLLCGHVFHATCIDKWFLKQHHTCPLCMACYLPQLPTEPQPSLAWTTQYV